MLRMLGLQGKNREWHETVRALTVSEHEGRDMEASLQRDTRLCYSDRGLFFFLINKYIIPVFLDCLEAFDTEAPSKN